ncbi:rhomboid family intramembrane serine protease [Halobacterium zhouii]|uniref:rhomboid family intramembrane serine protease n=1 Tax=Halobacterium zhouii TaxID=2902624 RepID=UPI001E5EAF14|nr:rhomboid family intramembrane serine protease [Halobacterium zhouii]
MSSSSLVVLAVAGATLAVAAAVPRLRRPALLSVGTPLAALLGLVAALFAGFVSIYDVLAYAPVLVVGAATAAALATGEGRAFVRRVRSRLLFGVPWGTALVTAFVVAFYVYVQFGFRGLTSPLVVPFVSWSYYYPLGVLTAPFAHAGLGHLTGNVIGTLAFAPLAEYAFSHYPTGRGNSSFGSWRTNPYVRAFVLFPLGVLAVALLSGVFAWGATIGFSGVVYAFAGFALVRYPLATVVAVTARSVVSVLLETLQNPIVYANPSPSFGAPWWAGIAVQGHLFGFLLGALLAGALVARRGNRPSGARVWFGGLVLLTSLSLWAVWWYGVSTQYVLYRAVGVLLVAGVAALLAAVVRAGDRTLVSDLTTRRVAFSLLLLPILTMSLVAVPVNLTTVQDAGLPGDPVEIRDYRVTYAEDVTNERVGAVDVPYFEQVTNVSASGVVVANPDRNIWAERVSAGALAFWGDHAVTVGGLGWEETVWVHRRGWVPTGAHPVYNVYVEPENGDLRPVFASQSATADPVVAGRSVRVDAREGAFGLRVLRNGSVLSSVGIPAQNETVTAAGLTFVRNGSRVVVVNGDTRVTIAHEEQYQ